MKKILNKTYAVEFDEKKSLTDAEVMNELSHGGLKMLVTNGKIYTQVGRAPFGHIDIVTMNKKGVMNDFTTEFEGKKTMEWIRKTYPVQKFYYGYFYELD